jgi:hypothetical protein
VIYGYPEEVEVDLIKHYENVYLCDIREVKYQTPFFPTMRVMIMILYIDGNGFFNVIM